MPITRTSTLPCGCPATWSDEQGQYVGDCHCPPEQRRAARQSERQELRQRREEAFQRSIVPLHRPFSLLR
jgi:hypothetical protein